jgi:hypothetical protein
MSDQLFPPLSPITAPSKRPVGPTWNTLCAAVVGVLVTAYIGLCAVEIYLLNRDVADINALRDLSPAVLEANLSTIEAHIATAHTVGNVYWGVFWTMMIAFFGWNAIVRSKLRQIGLQLDPSSSKAWTVWRISWIVSLIMAFMSRTGFGHPTTLDEAVTADHERMFYFVVRIVVGIAFMWVTYTVWKSAGGAFATTPAPAAPAYRLPEMPQPFPQATQAYEPPAQYQPPATLQPPTYQPTTSYQPPTDQV